MNREVLIRSAMASVLAAGLSAATNAQTPAPKPTYDYEKCYGVAKTAQNDCASTDGSHSCAGQAKADGAKGEFVYLPKGACNKIVGATLKPA
ncbi:MAG: DUF2282 domain-containing protein [Gammaproteobacteria bacterium]